ncbi:nitroreductase family protein [Rhodococcus sp. BP-149]|uniref:nitroreductase family protein n=1 Tax=unclassified Rhodococcus (in: high G+C Gram-positive bacteria) TaxID=192944 RepID=UPI001C9B5836|nr:MULTISPECIES: nitroreductase family protein [unclassified Rhodococcus (in: high G+C Gram-positive bacteria)]MBY6686566.1 nitroreductase family protein [Rhodococcus sp. BP-288]MBY6695276.1 nitroreductase family protein [Rhodococcus sp. BP-188]MBY6700058.1 nitroreductase family protein [Rhodococcus sp. BP-285]MBY6704919.1 nitroreductase family protein [Rhodococcus sp. BP-283]MBY6713183.1 nitroreductase family protein [Rhodococcus sp. BP-160]
MLDEYFAVTAKSQRVEILKARELWASRADRVSVDVDGSQLRPFPYRPWRETAAFDVVREVAAHRRSVRWFEPKPVDRATVMSAVEVGLMGPSACNRQSFRFFLLEDDDLRGKVAAVPMGTAGFADQIPLVGVIVGQHRGYEHQRDRHAIFVDGGLFAAGFIVALEASGLSSCCINWPELEDKNIAIQKLLDLDEDERVVMLIAIGYAQEGQLVPRSHKRSVENVVEWL